MFTQILVALDGSELAVPGVLNAAGYEAVSSVPKHLACYELESPAVIESDAIMLVEGPLRTG